MPTQIVFPMPDDWHIHVRDGEMMKAMLRFSTVQFCNNLFMPNLAPPLTSASAVRAYRDRMISARKSLVPIRAQMTLYLTAETTGSDIPLAVSIGVIAAKFYPQGGTTGSDMGLRSPRHIRQDALEAMEDTGMVLCLHGEVMQDEQPDPLLREFDFISHLEWLVSNYPQLKIVVEHVSDRRMLGRVLELPDTVAATITAHHPFLTHHDAVHDPHCSCMPIAKSAQDRDYLADIILRAHQLPKIFFGSDSAPHPEPEKQAGKFGVWSSSTAIPVLWDHFDAHGGRYKWEAFEAFMCYNGAAFYGVSTQDRPDMTLFRESWKVPDIYKGVVPYRAGEVLQWRVQGMEWFGTPYED